MTRSKWAFLLAIALIVAGGSAMIVSNPLVGYRSAAAAAQDVLLPPPTIGADGLFEEAWFHSTTGDLSRDAALAESEGKTLVIFWELEGCGLCARLHEALRIPALHAYMLDRFYAVQLDFQGDNSVRDFDGFEAAERDLARLHRARGAPTIEFLSTDGKVILRIHGYTKPPVLQSMFEFVDTGAYRAVNINNWLRARYLR